MKKNCELCKLPARTFCESDQASLCWDCDSKVHGANFLVERHTRTLLCRACQSPTPWKASGARLGNALSLCERCAGGRKVDSVQQDEESEGDNEDDVETDSDEEDSDEDEDDVDGDNQVVPWSSTAMPPPASSSSGSEESVCKCNENDEVVSQLVTAITLKRRRVDHDFQDSDSKNWKNQRREEDDLLGYVGEPSSKAAIRRYCDGDETEHSQPHD
ncbi:zinc finger protein CONSTANS-LIKE 2-like [Trifolium pratense]|uniref:zinc finger protein CONSTANS-LIKE 2-like n=1 Tax=Trifolium pratense TaxID=57577 RepID=UPI001E696530|nr:zinc finger protein CONSTANS-LIKE 2-like [Trifolium pratense]